MTVDQELLAAVRDVRRRLAEDGPARTRGDGDFERVSLPIGDGDALRDLLIAEQADAVIEIGLAYGASALAIGEALVTRGRDPVHVVIDAYQSRFHDAGRDVLTAAGLDAICSLETGRSQLLLPQLVAEGVAFDAAFVDGSHIFHNVFVDLHFLRELVDPGGLIIIDDCEWPSVATAVRYFELNTGWRREPIDGPTRLQAYRLPDPPVEPAFDGFVPFSR